MTGGCRSSRDGRVTSSCGLRGDARGTRGADQLFLLARFSTRPESEGAPPRSFTSARSLLSLFRVARHSRSSRIAARSAHFYSPVTPTGGLSHVRSSPSPNEPVDLGLCQSRSLGRRQAGMEGQDEVKELDMGHEGVRQGAGACSQCLISLKPADSVRVVQATMISDKIGPYANNWTEKVGGERWWPTSHDFAAEIAKCTRILRAFTVDGVEQKAGKSGSVEEPKTGLKTQGKVFMKIPAAVLRDAKAVCVYSSMRSGIAPLGGAGGSGVIVARLPDGSWSAPSCIAPATITGGLMLGVDIFEAVLVVNTDEALQTFYSHKITLGGQLAVTAGPYGAGALADAGTDRKPVLSYMRSRGAYIGAEAVASVYLCRFDENEREYACKGVTQRDIVRTLVPPPLSFRLVAHSDYPRSSRATSVRRAPPHRSTKHCGTPRRATRSDSTARNSSLPSPSRRRTRAGRLLRILRRVSPLVKVFRRRRRRRQCRACRRRSMLRRLCQVEETRRRLRLSCRLGRRRLDFLSYALELFLPA